MANMHLVTGHAGTNHVTAADHGSLNAAILGAGQYVLGRGNKFAATVMSNNSIRIADGDIMMQGRHVRIEEGAYVDLTIENGEQGMKRNDLIVCRYTLNTGTGVEEANLVVIKGTSAASDPVDPEYTSADIITDHAFLADMPLYRVPLDSLTVGELVPLFSVVNGVATVDGNGKLVQMPSASDVGAAAAEHDHSPDEVGAIPTSEKGVANGVATLGSNGKVTATQASAAIGYCTANKTLTADDMGKLIVCYSSALTVTIPAGMPQGTEVEIVRWGNTAVTIAAASGTTLKSSATARTIKNQYGVVSLKRISSSTDDWLLVGDLG